MFRFGLALTPFGHHPAAWRFAQSPPLEATALITQIGAAERAGLDFLLLDDPTARATPDAISPLDTLVEPTILASAAATLTRRIGLIAAADMGRHQPYNLARRIASLDSLSGGRAGWSVAGAPGTTDAAMEYLAVVRGLWDSWEDDAFIYDKAAGQFFEPGKMHVLHHVGPRYSVRGPLNVNRSPQGQPIVMLPLVAGTVRMVAEYADIALLPDGRRAAWPALVDELHRTLADCGRRRDSLRILARLTPWLGPSTEAAIRQRDMLDRHADRRTGSEDDRWTVASTAAEIADRIDTVRQDCGLDGVILCPPLLPQGLAPWLDDIAPVLAAHRTSDDTGGTGSLREKLGLQRPLHPSATSKGTA